MKRILVMMVSVGLIFMLVACGGNKVDDSTAEKYTKHAEVVITLLNEGNYEDLYARFDDTMKTALPIEEMDDFTPIIEESGSFKEIDKASVEEQDGYYVTVSVAKYSNKNRVYTISFNDKGEVAGLFVK